MDLLIYPKISEKNSETSVINGNGNLFGEVVRIGINFALKICNRNDWLVLINNDVTLTKNSFYELVKLAKKHKRKALVK